MMKRIKQVLFLTLILGALSMTSCIRQQNTWLLQDNETENNIFSAQKKPSYRVQPGDNIYININSTDKATSAYFQSNFPTLMSQTYLFVNSYVVNEDGYLTFSFIEKMFVQGLTIEEIQKKLQTTMNTYFKDVVVTVKLSSYAVSVLGEVNAPAKHEIPQQQVTILEAIALSEGFKEYADRQNILLVRKQGAETQTIKLNLQDKNIINSEYYYLLPNDVVYVQSMPTKSFTYEKLPYGLFISTISLVIAILAIVG